MRGLISKVIAFFTVTNERTWIGHSLQALGIQSFFVLVAWPFGALWLAFGAFFNAGFWFQREVIADYLTQIPLIGIKAANKRFLSDGWMDMVLPVITSVFVAIMAAFFIV